ncbi:MAG TPA: OsmC family peroxiredoxin, partial [Burkholderiales bacterium]|nr:OsmC family peroxiredoxin [Burkholderiales bacterium]
MSDPEAKLLSYAVHTRRMDALGSEASCKEARITLDTGLAGRSDASNPAQLRLAALSACMIKGIERVAPIIKFAFRGVEVRLAGVRQESPPRMARIDYEILID